MSGGKERISNEGRPFIASATNNAARAAQESLSRISPQGFSPMKDGTDTLVPENPYSMDQAQEKIVQRYNEWLEQTSQGSYVPVSSRAKTSHRRRITDITHHIENQFGGIDLHIILEVLYQEQKLSILEIAAFTGEKPQTIYTLLKRCGVQTRSRLEGIQLTWARRKDEIVEKIHAGDSDQKRSRSLTGYHASNPDACQRALQLARQASARNAQVRREEHFGEEVSQQLKRMHYFEGFTPQEIATRTGYSHEAVIKYMKIHRIDIITPSKGWRESNAHVRRFLPFLWSHPETIHCLSKNQRYVLIRRHLTEGHEATHDEIAREMGVSHQRVTQIEQKAIQRLSSLIAVDEE